MSEIQKIPLPEYRGMLDEALEQLIEGEKTYDVEFQIQRLSDGAIADIHSIAEYDAENNRVFGTLRDVTERNHAERARQLLQTQLAHAQRMESIGRLASGVSHDFNNLLQALTGTIQALRRPGAEAADLEANLAQLDHLVERGSRLTRQLLVFSRRDAERPQALDLNHLLTSSQNMLHRLLPETIEIGLEIDDRPLVVVIDPGRIEQVVVNLAVNAADAMATHGRLTLRTRNDQGSAVLEVEDTGTGIPDALRDRVFEPFFTTKEAGTGTGLGLSVVHGIVTEAGGTIDLGSSPAGGTLFTIRLPLVESTERLTPIPGDGGIVRGRGERVLVVDDDESVRLGIEQMLDLLGYDVTVTDGLQGALAAVADGSFDLLLTDMVLADGSGTEIATQLRARQAGLAVVMMSGYSQEAVEASPSELSAFLQKPFTLEHLAGTMRGALDDRTAGNQD